MASGVDHWCHQEVVNYTEFYWYSCLNIVHSWPCSTNSGWQWSKCKWQQLHHHTIPSTDWPRPLCAEEDLLQLTSNVFSSSCECIIMLLILTNYWIIISSTGWGLIICIDMSWSWERDSLAWERSEHSRQLRRSGRRSLTRDAWIFIRRNMLGRWENTKSGNTIYYMISK